jgi:hypothetical protein
MTCASDVTNKVASKPSEPWTSTDAPSYEYISFISLLMVVGTCALLFKSHILVIIF